MKRLIFAAAALFGLVTGAAAQEPEFTFKLHHLLGPTSPAQVMMLEPWVKNVEEDSGGRIKIEIYPAMSLGGTPPQLFRQAVDGVVDIIWTVDGYTPGLFPRSEVFELPTIFTNDLAAANLAMRDLFDEYLAPEYADVHVLFLHVHAGQAIYMRDKLTRSPADFAGLKVRVPGPTGNAVVEALGATPVTMPVPDLVQALSTNAVDGALIPWEIGPALKLQDSVKYLIEGPDQKRLGTTVFQVSMNKARWESLPDDIKEVFSSNSDEEWLKEVGRIWREDDDMAIKVMTDAGPELVVLTEDEWAKFDEATAPVVDRWVAEHKDDFDAEALAAAAREAIANHSQ